MLSLNEKLSEVQLLRLRAGFHALPLFYLRTEILRTYARKNYVILEINPKGSSAQNSRAEHYRPSQHSLKTRLQSSKGKQSALSVQDSVIGEMNSCSLRDDNLMKKLYSHSHECNMKITFNK